MVDDMCNAVRPKWDSRALVELGSLEPNLNRLTLPLDLKKEPLLTHAFAGVNNIEI
ncbi:hypothetical protein [Agrobacterium sp. El2ro-1b]|uniref:hypothetical protein n=1 Tax=Agrobacterium sp. El2ro-1b TaxID=2969528 RepID=UPI003AAD4570